VLDEVQPLVRRRVQVPGEVSLAVLHEVVQSAMGWTNSHLHEFEIAGRRYGPSHHRGEDPLAGTQWPTQPTPNTPSDSTGWAARSTRTASISTTLIEPFGGWPGGRSLRPHSASCHDDRGRC
jgi:hypothetical protein